MEGKKAPVNTTKQAKDDPLAVLAYAMVMGSSVAIEHQEAQGQRQFVESDTLPMDIRGEERAILETFGVKFLGAVPGDDAFQYVELPLGWRKTPTDHSMWSELMDEKGRKRASIFYKAAHYDRRANLSLCHRFSVKFDYDRLKREGIYVAHVMDGDRVIHTTDPVDHADGDLVYATAQKAETIVCKWLDKNYPDWKDLSAYWD